MNKIKRFVYKHTVVNVLLVIMICALYLITAAPTVTAVMSNTNYGPIYRGTKGNRIALQFAVSWDASAMDTILNTLDQDVNKITFVVSGDWAKNNQALLKRIAESGHEIGVMGMDPMEDGTLEWVVSDLLSASNLIHEISGVMPRLYYSGTRNTSISAKAAKKCGMTQVLCTMDVLCARGDAEDILKRALENQIEGSIILMQPTFAAAEALPEIISSYQEKGFGITCTGDVIG